MMRTPTTKALFLVSLSFNIHCAGQTTATSRQPVTALNPMVKQMETIRTAVTGGWRSPGRTTLVKKLPIGAELTAGTVVMRVTALSDGVFRVQLAPLGSFPVDNSWAVMKEATAAMKPTEAVRVSDAVGAVEIATKGIIARIEKNGLRMVFLDSARNVISEDDPNRPMQWISEPLSSKEMERSFQDPKSVSKKVATAFRIWKRMPDDEHYFGLGDKAGPLDHRNQAFTMWNTDAFGWQESTDPLYKSIPFFVALRNGKSYGIFLDNTFRSSFDFGKSERDAFSFGSDDGPSDPEPTGTGAGDPLTS